MTQDEAADMAVELYGSDIEDPRLLRALYQRAGIKTRHTIVPHRTAVEWATPRRHRAGCGRRQSDWPLNARTNDAVRGQRSAIGLRRSTREAIVAAKADPAEITHLVTVSCTGFAAPGVDVSLMRVLELSPGRTDACRLHGLPWHNQRHAGRPSDGDVRAGVDRAAVRGGTLQSALLLLMGSARAVGNAIFADGAAAVVASGTSKARPVAGGRARRRV